MWRFMVDFTRNDGSVISGLFQKFPMKIEPVVARFGPFLPCCADPSPIVLMAKRCMDWSRIPPVKVIFEVCYACCPFGSLQHQECSGQKTCPWRCMLLILTLRKCPKTQTFTHLHEDTPQDHLYFLLKLTDSRCPWKANKIAQVNSRQWLRFAYVDLL